MGAVGVAICWDQWFPEAARAMALQGADILLYPTAIGTEPQDPSINSADHWQRVMQGHAAANVRYRCVINCRNVYVCLQHCTYKRCFVACRKRTDTLLYFTPFVFVFVFVLFA